MGTGRNVGSATLQGKSLSVEIVSDCLSAHSVIEIPFSATSVPGNVTLTEAEGAPTARLHHLPTSHIPYCYTNKRVHLVV